jgi:hypothetical protein
MPVTTGADQHLTMQWESALADGPAADAEPFVPGADPVLDTNEATNNGTRVYLPASNRAVDITAGSFEGAFGLSFTLTSPWFLRAILGTPTQSGSGPTYTYTYDGDPEPFQLLEGYVKTGRERALQGCVPQSVVIDPSIDDEKTPVTVEGFYVDEELLAPTSITAQDDLDEDVLGYDSTTLSLDGATEKIVRSASLRLEADTRPFDGFGSRLALDYLVGAFTPSLTYTKVEDDNTSTLTDIYGGADQMGETVDTAAPLTLLFDNGATGSDTNRIEFGLSGGFPESYGESNAGDPGEPLEENLNRLIEDVTVTATNGQSATP